MSEVRCYDGETLCQARQQPRQSILELQQILGDWVHWQQKHLESIRNILNVKNVRNGKDVRNVRNVKDVKNVKKAEVCLPCQTMYRTLLDGIWSGGCAVQKQERRGWA